MGNSTKDRPWCATLNCCSIRAQACIQSFGLWRVSAEVEPEFFFSFEVPNVPKPISWRVSREVEPEFFFSCEVPNVLRPNCSELLAAKAPKQKSCVRRVRCSWLTAGFVFAAMVAFGLFNFPGVEASSATPSPGCSVYGGTAFFSMVLYVCQVRGVESVLPTPGAGAAAGAAAGATVLAIGAVTAGLVGSALVIADRARRDKDAKDSRDKKTITGYASIFRNFYRWCRGNGRPNLVPAVVAGEVLEAPTIFDNISHGEFEAEEADICSCFISHQGTNIDGSIASGSKQQSVRSAIVYYLRTRNPPRKLSIAAEVAVKAVMKGHLRHVVQAKAQGLMKVGRRFPSHTGILRTNVFERIANRGQSVYFQRSVLNVL